MALIKDRDLKAQIKSEGAMETAKKLTEAVSKGHLNYNDLPGIRCLYENFVTAKGKDKEPVGSEVLREEVLREEAGSLTSLDAFNTITSQIYFNALTTFYNAADFSVSPLFRVIPSNLPHGEKFGGISNLNTALQPVPYNRELPHLEPTEDYTASPPMQQKGAIIDIGLPLMKADATGEITDMFQRLGSALGTARELEAVSTLTDVGGDASRTRLNWKGTSYATYQASTPWINIVGSNTLLTPASLNSAYQALQNILDPYTGLPVVTPPGRLTLVVCPELLFTAQRLARGTEYATGGGTDTNFTPRFADAGSPPVEFDIVVSKYLKYHLDANSVATTTWYIGYPNVAFSWQQMYPITVGEALPNAGEMFSRNLAASYKAFKIETSFAFNPRYMVKNTVGA